MKLTVLANGVPQDSSEIIETVILGVSSRRWSILLFSCIAIILKGLNQSSYGPINNFLSKFLEIKPWQVDWFILSHSAVYVVMGFPFSWLTSRIGFRKSFILMTTASSVGFVLSTIGVSFRTGYPSIIIGQCLMGFSDVISFSLPPSTAAVWFPTSEVATAVALQIVSQGVGESIGSIMTPVVINASTSVEEIGVHLTSIFIPLSLISIVLWVAVLLFVIDQPPLPPSESRALALRQKKLSVNVDLGFLDAWIQYKEVVRQLFSDWNYAAVWFVFGAATPVLRSNSLHLLPILASDFVDDTNLNIKAGMMLMGGWLAYTVGGFIVGPVLTKLRQFKAVVLFSVTSECLFSIIVMLGMKFQNLTCVYVGVIATGFCIGMASTALFELIMEVTYPKPPMSVTILNIVCLGVFRLVYPIAGHSLLTNYGATASTSLPVAFLLLTIIVLIVIKPPYQRTKAASTEIQILIESDK